MVIVVILGLKGEELTTIGMFAKPTRQFSLKLTTSTLIDR